MGKGDKRGKAVSCGLLLILTLMTMTGCSSIVSKSKYPVSVQSTPVGAEYTIEDMSGTTVFSGQTPAKVSLDASSGYFQPEKYTIKIKKDGYTSHSHSLSSNIDGWYFGNLLIGGVLGMLVIDPLTGAMYKLPDNVNIKLDEIENSELSGPVIEK